MNPTDQWRKYDMFVCVGWSWLARVKVRLCVIRVLAMRPPSTYLVL